jgi:hypothetical protein
MARSAVRRHILPWQSGNQVVALLGPPDERITSPEDAGRNKLPGVETRSYYIGGASRYGFDDAFLYVHFDKRGRVIRSQINGY